MLKCFDCNHSQSALFPEVKRPDQTTKRLQTMDFCGFYTGFGLHQF